MLLSLVFAGLACCLKRIPNDVENLLRYSAVMTILPYCNQTEMKSKSLKILRESNVRSLQNITIQEAGDIRWMTAYDAAKNTIIISYRGSFTNHNWFQDFEMKLKLVPGLEEKGVKVHTGWYKASTSSLKQLEQQLRPLIRSKRNPRFLFAGHSSGGPIALITAFLTTTSGALSGIPKSHIKVISIGSPRVGNPAFQRAFDGMGWNTSLRLVKSADPMPYCPSQAFPFNYRHMQREVYVNGKDNIPVFCDQQAFYSDAGGCFDREGWLEVMSKPLKVSENHLDYLGLTLGTVACTIY